MNTKKPKMKDGTPVDVNKRTLENIIVTDDGIVGCRTIERKDACHQWIGAQALAAQGASWQPVTDMNTDRIPTAITGAVGEPVRRRT